MSDAKSPPELSVDEILASIQRILAEDERSSPPLRENGGSVPAPADDDEDVFDLTQAIAADGTVRSLVAPDPRPSSPVEAAGKPTPSDVVTRSEPLVSAAGTQRIVDSFTRLAETPPMPHHEPATPKVGGQPLDDAVPEMLRSMLQTWLDAHLPEIVERLVRDEIARITAHSSAG